MLSIQCLVNDNSEYYIFSLDDEIFWNYIIKKKDSKYFRIRLENIKNGFQYFFGFQKIELDDIKKKLLMIQFFKFLTGIDTSVKDTKNSKPKKVSMKERSAKTRKWKLCNVPYVSLHYTPSKKHKCVTFRIRFTITRSKAHPKIVRKDYPFTNEGLIEACLTSYDYSQKNNLPMKFNITRDQILKGDINNDLDFLEIANEVVQYYNNRHNQNYNMNLQFSKFSRNELN